MLVNNSFTDRPPLPTPFTYPERGDVLLKYLKWFLIYGPSCPMMPADGLVFFGPGPGIVLHRQAPLQTQLLFALPHTRIPEHSHPNVDSVEVHLGPCDLFFFIEGLPVIPKKFLYDERGGVSRWWGRGVVVKHGQLHHLEVGQGGGAFLSVQHWLNGKRPTSVDLDWEGEPMEKGHASSLVLEKTLTDIELSVADEQI